MEDVHRRDFLDKREPSMYSRPGFNSRAINRLALEKQSPDSLTIEINHLKRDIPRASRHIVPLLEYQLWLEAGKLDKMNLKIEQPDPEVTFSSNMWRNFRATSGLTEEKKNSVTASVSSLYPITIPCPSQVGSNTLSNFFDQNRYNMFKTDKTFNLAVARVENEATFMKFLRLKSELRNPPLDYDGSILPPKNFKKYPPNQDDRKVKASSASIAYRNKTLATKNIEFNSHVNFNSRSANSNLSNSLNKLQPPNSHQDYERIILERNSSKYKIGKRNSLVVNL